MTRLAVSGTETTVCDLETDVLERIRQQLDDDPVLEEEGLRLYATLSTATWDGDRRAMVLDVIDAEFVGEDEEPPEVPEGGSAYVLRPIPISPDTEARRGY